MTTAGNSLGRIQIRDLSIRLGQGAKPSRRSAI